MEMSKTQLFKKPGRGNRRGGAKAQSLVEFAITLPILILLFTGMIEFGFMLNTYLSVQDAVRSTARRFSTINPYDASENIDPDFYSGAAEYAIELLAPTGDPDSRQITLEAGRDNILISLIGVEVDESTDPDEISGINRFDVGGDYYKHFDETDPSSTYTDSAIGDFLTRDNAEPADAGFVIVEIYYGYEGTLNLPWTLPFFSPDNPSMMYVSAVMPTIYVKPRDTSGTP
jgi:hypothetical protein